MKQMVTYHYDKQFFSSNSIRQYMYFEAIRQSDLCEYQKKWDFGIRKRYDYRMNRQTSLPTQSWRMRMYLLSHKTRKQKISWQLTQQGEAFMFTEKKLMYDYTMHFRNHKNSKRECV